MTAADDKWKVVIPGSSGQVGTMLARYLVDDGHEVVVLSRQPGSAPWKVVAWDGRTLGPWADEIERASAVINNADFMRILRQAWGASLGLPAPAWLLEVGALLLRTETELVLKSRRVIPGRLLKAGFPFHLPHWPEAAADLCRRWRQQQSA